MQWSRPCWSCFLSGLKNRSSYVSSLSEISWILLNLSKRNSGGKTWTDTFFNLWKSIGYKSQELRYYCDHTLHPHRRNCARMFYVFLCLQCQTCKRRNIELQIFMPLPSQYHQVRFHYVRVCSTRNDNNVYLKLIVHGDGWSTVIVT